MLAVAGDSGSLPYPDEDLDISACAICFEEKPPIKLPCDCRICYCNTCWDRALASSVSLKGRATCPTCRMHLRIDYDPESRGLVFSKEEVNFVGNPWKTRVYGKARSVQIRLLQDYGRSLMSKSQPVLNPKAITTASTERQACQLLCVCGAHMDRLDTHSRIIRMLDDIDESWKARVPDARTFVESLRGQRLITCDLCEKNALTGGDVFTCQNGMHTVLHPSAYDVCEKCFLEHTSVAAADVGTVSSPPRPSPCNQPGSSPSLLSMARRFFTQERRDPSRSRRGRNRFLPTMNRSNVVRI